NNVYEHCTRKDAPIRSPMGIGAGLGEHLAPMERSNKIPIGDRLTNPWGLNPPPHRLKPGKALPYQELQTLLSLGSSPTSPTPKADLPSSCSKYSYRSNKKYIGHENIYMDMLKPLKITKKNPPKSPSALKPPSPPKPRSLAWQKAKTMTAVAVDGT
nr:hypothetical protein [Tanacetum cinerariifolium]